MQKDNPVLLLFVATTTFATLLFAPPLYAQPKPERLPSPVCEAIKRYPRIESDRLAFDAGEISPICAPYLRQKSRKELDRCGDNQRDPYASFFTWASRSEMGQRGKVNIYTDAELQPQIPRLMKNVAELRSNATQLCCGDDAVCKRMMDQVEVSFCKPSEDPNAPDPCVFGGSYKMPGDGYLGIFRAVQHRYSGTDKEAVEIRQIASRNLGTNENPGKLSSGSIALSSYIQRDQGLRGFEPTLLHEFGHACAMVKMQEVALSGSVNALRAIQWLDRARSRCQADLELPEGYFDFWESIGESRGLAQCLQGLTIDNQKQRIDRPCPALCPGHFLEESVGIVFSLLLGDLSGASGAVFPQTCDHVRDGQHPMVSDVLECLAQNSPRFRERLRLANRCGL